MSDHTDISMYDPSTVFFTIRLTPILVQKLRQMNVGEAQQHLLKLGVGTHEATPNQVSKALLTF